MVSLKKVQDCPGLVRDVETHAVINTNESSFLEAKKRKQALLEKDKRITNLETNVSELKEMMQKILEIVSNK